MEAIDENIQLPTELPKEGPEHSVTLEKIDQNSASTFPMINTDDLPITPVKKWLNNVTSSPESPQKICLNIMPLSKMPTKSHESDKTTFYEDLESSCKELNSINLPNTDNLLDINVPKTTLLGKEQAKKRLHAFSLAKQNSLSASPLLKKNARQSKYLLQPVEEKYNENGERTDEKFVLIKKPARKCANPGEKAKAVIEEIEEIKKIESAYLEAVEQGLLDNRHRKSRSRSRSRERNHRHSKKIRRGSHSFDVNKSRRSYEKFKYPKSWTEFKTKRYDFETLVSIKSKDYKSKDNELHDFRKQLLFQKPSLPLHRLTITCINGKDKSISAEYIRFTSKMPKISYSTTDMVPNDTFLRKNVLDYVPRSFQESFKKIVNHSTVYSDLESPTKVTMRKWYPKTVLNRLENETECTILETSLGLSFLQNYSDEDELEKEDINEYREHETKQKEAKTDTVEDANSRREIISKNETEDVQDQNTLKKEKHESASKNEKCKDVSKNEKGDLNSKAEISTKSESEMKGEEHVKKRKVKKTKRKKKEKHKVHSKVKKGKRKKKKSSKKEDGIKKDKSKKKQSTVDDEIKKHKKHDNKLVDSHKAKTESDKESKKARKISTSAERKDKKITNIYKDEKIDYEKKGKKKINDGDGDDAKPAKESRKSSFDSNKSEKEYIGDMLVKEIPPKKESRKSEHTKNKTAKTQCEEKIKDDKLTEKEDSSKKQKSEEKYRSKSQEHKSKKKVKEEKNQSSKNEKERKVKCVAEKEFGTPDTDEYYSNWESDVELNSSLMKPSDESFNQSTSINRSWESDDEHIDIPMTDIPLAKSPCRINKSPLRHSLSKDRSVERDKRYKREKSPDRNRSLLRDRSLERSSPTRARLLSKSSTRSRHDFSEGVSPIRKEFSPFRNKFSPVRNEFSPMHSKFSSPIRNKFSPVLNEFSSVRKEFSPVSDDYSPFRKRCVDERRRSRRSSLERSPLIRTSSEPFLEMPLNLRNVRKGYSRNKWEEERFDSNSYNRSPDHIEFNFRMSSNENKAYALYAEDSWERDDYLTEEMRLKEERQTLIEERRQLEIEKRKLEELNRQRFYSHSLEIRDQRCSIEERRQDQFNSEEEDRYNRTHRSYREDRQIQTYSKEKDMMSSRRSVDDQRIRRRYSSERSLEKTDIQRDRPHDSFNWEDCVETKKSEKYFERSQEQELHKDRTIPKRRSSRWQNIDDLEDYRTKDYIRNEEQQVSEIKSEGGAKEQNLHAKNEFSSAKSEDKTYEREKKVSRKARWESSEDEIVQSRDDKKSHSKETSSIQNKQEEHRKRDYKEVTHKHKERVSVSSKEKQKQKHRKERETKQTEQLESITDNLDLHPRKTSETTTSQVVQKPELLENEYEKFMQALGSEISTSEDISERDNKKNKHKISTSSKPSNKKVEKRKVYVRAISISSEEEPEKISKKKSKKRILKKKVSSSSSSSTSSSSSDSDSSSGSSSSSSSSESSSSAEKRRKLKKRKINVKIKHEKEEVQEKNIEPKIKSTRAIGTNFDISNTSNTIEKEAKVVIKIEEADLDMPNTETISEVFLNSKINVLSPSKIINTGTNLNIINLSAPEFSLLGEIPLPNPEIQKSIAQTAFSEAPLPVPSPKIDLIASTTDTITANLDPLLPKIEPIASIINPPLSNSDSLTIKTDIVTTTLPVVAPEKVPLAPVTTPISHILPISPKYAESEMAQLNTLINVHVDIKQEVEEEAEEEPIIQEENASLCSEAQVDDTSTSPVKRSNLIAIKFLTEEVRKQANESTNVKAVGIIETKDILVQNNQSIIPEVKTNIPTEKTENIQLPPLTNLKRYFTLSSMNLPATQPAFDESGHDENSNDFTDKFVRREEKDDKSEEVSTSAANEQFSEIEHAHHSSKSYSSPKTDIHEHEKRIRTSPDYSREKRRHRSISPGRKRDLSPKGTKRDRSPWRHESPKKWGRDTSPRRKERKLSPRSGRNSSPKRWNHDGSPRRGSKDSSTRRSRDDLRHSMSPKRKRDNRSISPRNTETRKRNISPRQRSPASKRRSTSREFSPKMHRNRDRSPSKERKIETIQETLQRIAGVDKYSNLLKRSPLSSPLHGFKRSVADSTISDDQLLQRNLDEYTESPGYNTEYFKNSAVSDSPSPRRISLDERINQALGLTEQPKPISTTYSSNYESDQQYFEQFGQCYEQYGDENRKSGAYNQSGHSYHHSRQRGNSNLKVVQVGNILQVVPTEDVPEKKPPLQQNKVTNSTQKIVQVGNMLQIVPTTTLPEKPQTPTPTPIETPSIPLPASPTSVASEPSPTPSLPKDTFNAEVLIKQKAERRAEKDNRRQERERKRKEKEKKKKERERRKQMKLKLHTEAMIKQALILDTEDTVVAEEENSNVENTNEPQTPVQWPPVPQIVFSSSHKPAGKGILSQGFRGNLSKGEEGDFESYPEKRKSVKFSDGVVPGEGTSPSGGEELSSPPPAPRKLPKEKRFKKTKIPKIVKVPKKKKVKVKVIRQQQTQVTEDDDDEEDNLPPPPAPPGSPPPHLFPARIKPPVINNVHPNVVVSIANPSLQQTDTSYPPPLVYQPGLPVIMSHNQGHHGHLPSHHGHHGHLPSHHGHHIPPPCPPLHHGGFNPPTVIVPPVISVVPSVPNFGPPQHHHHHHGGHHHHHHSPHRHHH